MKIMKMMNIMSQQTSVHPLTAVGSVRVLGLLSKHPMMIKLYFLIVYLSILSSRFTHNFRLILTDFYSF